MARRGIRFVARNARRRKLKAFRVDYHGGGEPTVLWRVMTKSFAYAQDVAARLGLSVAGSLTTNGVLSDSQIDWITSQMEGATVSMDGPPEIHDANRLTVLGQGSSQRVLHTMRRFDEAGFHYGIRMTLTAEHVAASSLLSGSSAATRAPPAFRLSPRTRWAGDVGRSRPIPTVF